MNVQVNEAGKTKHGSISFDATCGKVSAYVHITEYDFNVCCRNASHKAWRGYGKIFRTAADALANYKSGEMQAIIAAAIAYQACLTAAA
jgi:hypothetical protein